MKGKAMNRYQRHQAGSSTRRATPHATESVPSPAKPNAGDQDRPHPHETAILSEVALGKDWNRPEEDAAWAYLKDL